jgi:hypothetical protein
MATPLWPHERVDRAPRARPGRSSSGELFRQRELSRAARARDRRPLRRGRAELDACLKSPETEKKLQADIAWAVEHDIHGTPMLLVGGRKALAFPPLLYVLALTRGSPSHPEFAALPPPKPLPVHAH